MLLTLNQVISQITTLAAAHSQIAASGVGDFAEWQAEERNYPLLWVFHETTNVGNRELIYSIRLICADRVITGEEGEDTDGMEQEVLSDTLLILLDFLAYFQQQHSQTYTVVPSATIDPFTERFNDRVAGNSMVIQIRQPFTWDACQIPQTGATIPPTVDGLTLYDFCDPSVIARLTADQVACLEAEYDLPCAAVTQQVNGTTIGTTASGGTNNQLIRNTAGTAVGTAANPSVIANTTIRNSAAPTWTDVVVAGVTKTLAQGKALDSDGATTLLANYIPAADGFMFTCTPAADATVTINGASLGATGTIPSGGSEDLDVLQGGVATGSWNGSAWIIPTCPAVPSLSVAVASGTPTYNGTVLITATPSNITPTSYTFVLPDEDRGFDIVTQVGNTYLWTVTSVGTDTIRVTATDGASTVGGTASVTVTDPLDYLTRINHWRADTGVTTVGNLADVWSDQGTAGINLSATVAARRTYYDTQRQMLGIQSGQILENAAGGYAGKSALTFFCITQKQAAVATNTRLIEMGAGQVGVAMVGVAGSYDILFGFSNFSSYVSANAGIIAGKCVIVTYDGSLAANRSVVYANGVALPPVATVGLGGPASVSAGVGIRAFVSNAGSFNYIGTCAVIGVMDGVLTPTQVAALNGRLTQIHVR